MGHVKRLVYENEIETEDQQMYLLANVSNNKLYSPLFSQQKEYSKEFDSRLDRWTDARIFAEGNNFELPFRHFSLRIIIMVVMFDETFCIYSYIQIHKKRYVDVAQTFQYNKSTGEKKRNFILFRLYKILDRLIV